MPKFTKYDDLEKYLTMLFPEILGRSRQVESVIIMAMSQAVYDVVYGAFETEEYVRREHDGGLSDIQNMGITDFGINENGEAYVIFENLTEGQDTLKNKLITDTIVDGIKNNWKTRPGPWTEERDFIGEAARAIRENPTELLDAFKNALVENGFIIK
ncbi:hypothetical protein NSQ62_07780 [Solibacillus sp. FSL H8-0523]|uniref:hypothetical protein n=1 Tax=Solibacillus sp. FSL H8-0523 TaxID=2954511 RepID=UPI003101903B